jgi:hypothetical protein
MMPNFESEGDEGVLTCPICGSRCLHHGRIVTYDRSDNDPNVFRTKVGRKTAVLAWVRNSKDNPSYRRQGVTIQFDCESCGDIGELTIAQRKGETCFRWRGRK